MAEKAEARAQLDHGEIDVISAAVKRRMTRVVPFAFAPLVLLALIAHSDGQTGQHQAQPVQTASNDPEAIPLKMQGGTLLIPVLINGQITLNFTIDSGATDVTIPVDVVSTLIRTGTVQKSDFIGQENFRLADGSTVPSPTFVIRSLKVGNHLLENVTASVVDAKADLLLGQSFLSRFNSWAIDNKRQVLLLNSTTQQPPPQRPPRQERQDRQKAIVAITQRYEQCLHDSTKQPDMDHEGIAISECVEQYKKDTAEASH